MKLGIILETKEPEKAWNALRFGVTASKQGHKVKFFLMGEAVEIESIKNEELLQELKKNIGTLALPNSATVIANKVLELAKKH